MPAIERPIDERSRIVPLKYILKNWEDCAKGQAAITRMIVAGILGLVIFVVVFFTLKWGGVDLNISAILAVAAGFGSIAITIRVPIGS